MENITKPDLRERVLKRGLKYPTDEELIMLLIGTGSKDTCVELLSERILKVIDTSDQDSLVPQLLKIKGVGQSKALAVAAAVELGRRRTCHLEAKIKCPSDIIKYVQNYAMKSQEHFLSVCLSGAHEIMNINVASVGTVNRTIVHPRDVFTEAIRRQAAAVIVCHNHPSGNCFPSKDDIETTRKLKGASELLGITLLDHIIINKASYFSFVEHKML